MQYSSRIRKCVAPHHASLGCWALPHSLCNASTHAALAPGRQILLATGISICHGFEIAGTMVPSMRSKCTDPRCSRSLKRQRRHGMQRMLRDSMGSYGTAQVRSRPRQGTPPEMDFTPILWLACAQTHDTPSHAASLLSSLRTVGFTVHCTVEDARVYLFLLYFLNRRTS